MKKVSFIVYFPYQWFIYRNIYEKLPADKREVIVDLNANPLLQDDKVREDILALLKKNGVIFREIERMGHLNATYFSEFFSEVEVIVSCWELGCVSSPYTAHIKKINTTYGLAKELTMLRPTRSHYDVILAYGDRDQDHFKLLTKSVAIGNPRLDNFYCGIVDSSVRMNANSFFKDLTKKMVLYVPTHGDLGSSSEMLHIFGKLSKYYNIVFKPHYYTLREDKGIVEKYRQIGSVLILDDTWDTIEAMAMADIIVSDNSSAIFDSMQVDKPLVVCDFFEENFLDVVHKNIRFTKRGVIGASTYSDSFEQEIKNKGLVATIKKPDALWNALENIEEIDGNYREFRRKIVTENFKYTDGQSSARAAEVIMSVYNTKRNHVPGILHHAYLSYNNRIYRAMIESQNRREILVCDNKVIVWIFCEAYSNRDEILAAIYSALNEREVVRVCVSGEIEKKIVNMFSCGKFSQKVSFFESHTDGMNFVYQQLEKNDNLLFVKPNTKIEDVYTILNYKVSCERDMLFFSENTIFDSDEKISKLLYLLKYEILGFKNFSRNTLLVVSREQICSLEKSACLIGGRVLLEHAVPLESDLSLEGIFLFFIMINSLKNNQQYGMPTNDFALMPNFFMNSVREDSMSIFKKLVAKGMTMYSIGISMEKWPDKKIGKFLLRIIMGEWQYYQLLKLLLVKIARARGYIFLSKVRNFLNQKLKSLNSMLYFI